MLCEAQVFPAFGSVAINWLACAVDELAIARSGRSASALDVNTPALGIIRSFTAPSLTVSPFRKEAKSEAFLADSSDAGWLTLEPVDNSVRMLLGGSAAASGISAKWVWGATVNAGSCLAANPGAF